MSVPSQKLTKRDHFLYLIVKKNYVKIKINLIFLVNLFLGAPLHHRPSIPRPMLQLLIRRRPNAPEPFLFYYKHGCCCPHSQKVCRCHQMTRLQQAHR